MAERLVNLDQVRQYQRRFSAGHNTTITPAQIDAYERLTSAQFDLLYRQAFPAPADRPQRLRSVLRTLLRYFCIIGWDLTASGVGQAILVNTGCGYLVFPACQPPTPTFGNT
ncbi:MULTISPECIES: hypothetical protein [unclassified Leifsonia]|uniref:hypothetical protein n=1 Tax=unclassified Leifsonia TaxID=2663824 RepID=UPI0006FE9DAA|nr:MULTISPECIES: hypothetical protein [unclassified Leifsonia]KQX07747.1 hypothetical protein ASC59_08450 [Leifsonia sp. Root1293]KRA12029.1 hypothetical protein ASD61_08450 [Leifsonia sp. Root60]